MAVESQAFDKLMQAMIYRTVLLFATLIVVLVGAVKYIGDGVLWASPHHVGNTMPKVDDDTLRKRYEQAKADWDERQKENRARQRREKTQADARRRTIIGEMVLHHVQQNPHERERLMTRLDGFLKDARDRALFDLPPKPEAPASVPSTEPSSPTDTTRP